MALFPCPVFAFPVSFAVAQRQGGGRPPELEGLGVGGGGGGAAGVAGGDAEEGAEGAGLLRLLRGRRAARLVIYYLLL